MYIYTHITSLDCSDTQSDRKVNYHYVGGIHYILFWIFLGGYKKKFWVCRRSSPLPSADQQNGTNPPLRRWPRCIFDDECREFLAQRKPRCCRKLVAGSAAHLLEVVLLPSGCKGVLSNLSVQTGLRRAHRGHFGLSSRPPVGTSSTASI